jgi:NOL1/NOP2/fmu family ribosome biogenesis protein
MQQLKILNSKEKKRIQQELEKQFDSEFNITDYSVFMNPKNKIFILNKDVSKLNFDELRINSLGLYLGVLYENSIRLSIEGSQLIGKKAKKNVLELSDEKANLWMSGEDFEVDSNIEGFVILKNKKDFLGSGKISNKKLYNYVPKERRS